MSTTLTDRSADARDARASRPPEYPDLGRSSPGTVLILILAGAAGVVWMWWQNTDAPTSTAQVLIHLGRVTGLLAGYTVVVLIALMARVPSLERGIGTDRLSRWHANGGRLVVTFATVHALFIVWGYAVEAATDPLSESKTLLLTYPGVLAATVALGLFLLVGAASARAARRRLRYETWQFIHFYTYLAVALSFSHQLTAGAEFVNSPFMRRTWWVLYLGVGALVLWYRWLTPLRSSSRHRLRVMAVYEERPGVVSVVLRGRHLDELGTQPGQFFRWRFLTRELWWSANPYSLSAAPHHRTVRITVAEVGDHSSSLRDLVPGTRVVAEGPYGALGARPQPGRPVLLIAGGMGITPMRALFETIPAAPGALTLLYRASRESDLLFTDELDEIADARSARLQYVVGPRGGAADPTMPGVLEHLLPQVGDCEVYVCASPGLTDAFLEQLHEAEVPPSRIHVENFAL